MAQMTLTEIQFQFTHPGRGATAKALSLSPMSEVSIHAPREGCDLESALHQAYETTFQFTHPGRGATFIMTSIVARIMFQFTHPGRGATDQFMCVCNNICVSIHAPREGCDLHAQRTHGLAECFNSRTPGGVRLQALYRVQYCRAVSIHAPREGCDAPWWMGIK